MEGLVSNLFNRAVLDTLTGLVTLGLASLLLIATGLHVDLGPSLIDTDSGWLVPTIIAAAFLVGTIGDRLSYQILDKWALKKLFMARISTTQLPPSVMHYLNQRHGEFAGDHGGAPSKDQQPQEVSALRQAAFLAIAKPEQVAKHSDLVANFQFNSNLLVNIVLSIAVIPIYFIHVDSMPLAILGGLIALGISLTLYHMTIDSIARYHGYEDDVIYSGILNGWTPYKG